MSFHQIDEFTMVRWIQRILVWNHVNLFSNRCDFISMSFYQIDVISNRCNSIKSMSLLSNRCDFISMRFHQIDEFLRVRWNIQGTGIQDTINKYKRRECCTQQSVLKPSTKKNKEVAIRGGGGRGVLCLIEK